MQRRHEKCTRRAVCECVCVSLCPRCACMHEIGWVRLTPVHRGLFFYTPALIPAPSDLPTFAKICTCDSCPEAPPPPPAGVLNAVLPPLGCLPGLNVLFWLDMDTLFSCFCFLLCSVSRSFNSHCLCGGNHLLGCEKGERGRERDDEGEAAKNRRRERTGVACRLEIIGVRISGQSVVCGIHS